MTTRTPSGHADMPSGIARMGSEETQVTRLDVSKLTITLTDAPKPLPDPQTLGFGTAFSDHMVIVSCHPVSGWTAPEIRPYGPITIDPSASCFQYGSNVFEGMKAYLGPDGKVRLFRPSMNMRRLERSAARLALPPIDGDAVLELIKRFVQIERRWIPTLPGYSFYIRPTIIATRLVLGVAPSDSAILCIFGCSSAPYFPRPISLLAVSDAVRAWPGGTGGHKIAGNYSPTFLPQRQAAAQGFDQILWLFGDDQRVTEAGAMNVMVVVDRADGQGWDVITAPLDGMILPGVTRASCLELLADPAFHATLTDAHHTQSDTATPTQNGAPPLRLFPAERAFTLADLERWSTEGALREILCVGTAVTVAPAHNIGFDGRVIIRVPTYPDDANGLGPVGRTLRTTILAVQEGRKVYKGWGVVVSDEAQAERHVRAGL